MVVADSLVFSFFYPIIFFLEATLDMASSTSQSNHVYDIIQHRMSDNVNRLAVSLFSHYGETDDAFLIGGLV